VGDISQSTVQDVYMGMGKSGINCFQQGGKRWLSASMTTMTGIATGKIVSTSGVLQTGVLDVSWLAFPNYDGNGKYQSMGNLLKNPHVGMLFMAFEQGRRLRLQGIATIQETDQLLTTYPGAQFIVRIQVTEVYNNCPRYIHTYQRVERSQYVPRGGHEPPIPEWKLRVETPDLLPAHDPARKVVGGTPAQESSAR
jgi:hypothetical protein